MIEIEFQDDGLHLYIACFNFTKNEVMVILAGEEDGIQYNDFLISGDEKLDS